MTTERNFLECSTKSMRQACNRIESCVGKMDEDQIWMRAGENSNSCGNLCLHLA